MDTPVGQMIILSFTIMFICILIINQFMHLNESKAVETKASAAIVELASEYDDPWKQSYDGLIVSGAEVFDEIKRCIMNGTYSVVFTSEALKDNDFASRHQFSEQSYVNAVVLGSQFVTTSRFCKTDGSWNLSVNGTAYNVLKGNPNTPSDKLEFNATYKGYVYRDIDDVIRMIVFVKQ